MFLVMMIKNEFCMCVFTDLAIQNNISLSDRSTEHNMFLLEKV